MISYKENLASLGSWEAQRIFLLLIALATLSLFSSWSSNPRAAANISREPANEDIRAICNRIAKIKVLPFKDEPVADPVFNELAVAKEKAFPCLIEKVTDLTPMPDPRMSYKYGDVRVGDVALFVLMHFAELDFDKILPRHVQEKISVNGVYVYFEFVEKPENRKEIQNNLQKWYHDKYGGSKKP